MLLERNGAQIHYTFSGLTNSPVLVLLHGGFGSAEDFDSIHDFLSQHYTILSIDSRGQGRSTLGASAMSYQLLQEDVEAILKKHHLSAVSILGYSDGGIIAYRLAAFTDLDIDWIISIGARWHVKQTDRFNSLLKSLNGETWSTMFPDKYQLYQKLNPSPDYDKLTKTYVKMCLDNTSTGHPNEHISKISCPILAIRGETDEVVLDHENKELASLINHIKIKTISDVGHAAHIEAPKLFLANIKGFIDRDLRNA